MGNKLFHVWLAHIFCNEFSFEKLLLTLNSTNEWYSETNSKISCNKKDEHSEWFSFLFSLKLTKTVEPTHRCTHSHYHQSVVLFSSVKITSSLLWRKRIYFLFWWWCLISCPIAVPGKPVMLQGCHAQEGTTKTWKFMFLFTSISMFVLAFPSALKIELVCSGL